MFLKSKQEKRLLLVFLHLLYSTAKDDQEKEETDEKSSVHITIGKSFA